MIYYSSTPNQTDAGETCSQAAGGRNSYQEGCLTRIPNFGPAEIGAIFSYILSSENLLLMKAFDEIAGEYEIEWESDQNVTARLRNGGVRSPLINTLLLQLYRQVRDENRAQLQQRVQ